MAREYFCAYHSYIKQCKGLSDGELGRLFRALLEYSASGKVPELNGRESVAIAIECKELLFVVEGVHGETFHRVDLIFSCEYIDNMPDAVLHGDTNQVGIGWLDISTLNLQPLYPSKLRRQIMNYYQGKPYKVYLGNEEAGDPECLD